MGDGISDLARRNECSEEEADEYIRDKIRQGDGCITWWPGGFHHSTILRLRDRGEVTLTDVSVEQETKYEVRFSS